MKWMMGGVYEFIFRFFGFLQSFVDFSYLEIPHFSRENPTVMLSMQFDQKNDLVFDFAKFFCLDFF